VTKSVDKLEKTPRLDNGTMLHAPNQSLVTSLSLLPQKTPTSKLLLPKSMEQPLKKKTRQTRKTRHQLDISSTSQTEKQLMFQEVKMKKLDQSLYGRSITEPTRNGELSILIQKPSKEPRDSMKNMDSTLTDHST